MKMRGISTRPEMRFERKASTPFARHTEFPLLPMSAKIMSETSFTRFWEKQAARLKT
jgi:hypothetical protein